MRLTDRALRNLCTEDKDLFVADGGGLYVRVRRTGTKTFLQRSQRSGSRWTTIGTYPAMSLADARRAVADSLASSTPRLTVSAVWRAFHQHIKRTLKRPDIVAQQLEHNLIPALGDKPIPDVTRTDVADMLAKIVKRGAPSSANRTLTYTKQLFTYAVERGWLTENVVAPITAKSVGGREKSRARTLTVDEIKALITWLRTPGPLAAGTRAALALMLITGQRADEVLGMRDKELALPWWTIPAERTKAARAQKVYLPPLARLVLRRQPRRRPSIYTVDQALRRYSDRAGARFTPHDLRRTMATHLAEHGVGPHIIEKMLSHQMTGVMAIYNRAEYLADRRAAHRLWSRLLLQWTEKRPGG